MLQFSCTTPQGRSFLSLSGTHVAAGVGIFDPSIPVRHSISFTDVSDKGKGIFKDTTNVCFLLNIKDVSVNICQKNTHHNTSRKTNKRNHRVLKFFVTLFSHLCD